MSLNLRFGFLTIGLLVTAVLTLSYLFDRERIAALVSAQRMDLKTYADHAADELTRHMEQLCSDTLFLSRLPSIKALPQTSSQLQPEHPSPFEYTQIAQAFLALGHARPEYFQLRLIGNDEEAREWVRIERQGSSLIEMEPSKLQSKANRYYVKEGMRLRKGQVRLTRIDLNREYNRISQPETTTLRAITPVMDAKQRIIALVVINLDMGQVFKHMSRYIPATGQLYLLNDEGYFLYHPDPSKAMTFDRAQHFLVTDEFPEHAQLISQLRTDAGLSFQTGSGDRDALTYATRRSLTTFPDNLQTITLIVTETNSRGLLEFAQARRNSYLIIALLIIMASLLALILGHGLTRSLRKLGEVSQAVSLGRYDVEVPAAPQGELSHLSHAFEQMIRTLKNREEQLQQINFNLEDEVKERTRELEESKTNLARERLLLESILDHVGDGVVAVDKQGQFLLWNQRAEELIGIGAANIPPDEWPSHFGLYRSPNEYLLRVEELPLMRALHGETVRNQDLYIRNELQEGHWISVFARPLGNPPEDMYGAVAVLVDIEETRKLREQREIQMAEMEKIGRLTLIGQIVENVAHRLSQPLAAIANYTGAALLLHSYDKLDDERLGDILNHIARLAERGGQVLDEFRKLAVKRELSKEKLEINSIVQAALHLISDRLTRLNILIEKRLLPDLPPVFGQKIALQEAVIYLLINCLESLSSTEGQPRRLYLNTSCTADRKHLEITVGDNGPDVALQNVDRIFEPWFTTKPGALGLGLTVARSVAENHNGTLRLQQREDHLTWFVFELPAYDGQ